MVVTVIVQGAGAAVALVVKEVVVIVRLEILIAGRGEEGLVSRGSPLELHFTVMKRGSGEEEGEVGVEVEVEEKEKKICR